MKDDEPTDAEITDFIDGRLSGTRRLEVERWLAEHPARASEVERQRQLNEALKDLGAEILDEPVPERLREVLRRPSPREASPGGDGGASADDRPAGSRRWFSGPTGAIGLILIGMAIGWIVQAALVQEESASGGVPAVPFAPEQVAAVVPSSDQPFAPGASA